MVLPRSEKAGAATRVDAVCSYYSGPEGFTLDRERLYWELSQMTQGVTHLGPYTLDRDSLYVNGEYYGLGSLPSCWLDFPLWTVGSFLA